MGLKLPKYKPICIEANLLKRAYPAKTARLIKYKATGIIMGLGRPISSLHPSCEC
jgi:hypothetical protein